MHYLERLQQTVRNNWEKPALCNYGGEEFKFSEIAEYIEKFHIFFEKSGVKKGDHIAVCAKNTARWAISFLAINTYEAVVVPILADFHPDSVNNLVDHSESEILFTDSDIYAKLDITKMPRVRIVIAANDFTILYARDEASRDIYASLPELFSARYPMGFSGNNVSFPVRDNDKDIAVINYTSGTTSAPKGVMLRYECFSAMVDYSITHVYVDNTCSIVSMLPMGHIYGLVFEFLYTLCSGVHIFFLGKTPSPSLLLKALSDVKPYMIVTVPLVMEKIYKSSIKPVVEKWYMKLLLHTPLVGGIIYRKIGEKLLGAFGGNIRMIILGGAAFSPEVEKHFKRMGMPYTVGYGMTEAAPILAYDYWDRYVPGSCGSHICCTEIRIDSEDPEHIAGEILGRGTNICIGYY